MKIELLTGKWQQHLPTLKKGSVDVVIFSPPYNIGVKYDIYQDKMNDKEYRKSLNKLAKQLHYVLNVNGSVFINVAGSLIKPMLPHYVALIFSRHFVLQNSIVWVKSICIAGKTYGHFNPVNSDRFLPSTHEYILHFTKQALVKLDRLSIGVPFSDKSNIARRQHGQDLRPNANVWFMKYKTRNSKNEHPATFPIELPLNCLKLHGKTNPVVLDPYSGTSVTGLAAKQYGAKKYIGIELSPSYQKIARQSLKATK